MFWRAWLEEQLYYFLLVDNFRPTSQRVLDAPGDLSKGKIGAREALHRIVLSASFDRRNPGPDTFVTVVMENPYVSGIKMPKYGTYNWDSHAVNCHLFDDAKIRFTENFWKPGPSQPKNSRCPPSRSAVTCKW